MGDKHIKQGDVDRAIRFVKKLNNGPQKHNLLNILETIKMQHSGYIVHMSKANFKKYMKNILRQP